MSKETFAQRIKNGNVILVEDPSPKQGGSNAVMLYAIDAEIGEWIRKLTEDYDVLGAPYYPENPMSKDMAIKSLIREAEKSDKDMPELQPGCSDGGWYRHSNNVEAVEVTCTINHSAPWWRVGKTVTICGGFASADHSYYCADPNLLRCSVTSPLQLSPGDTMNLRKVIPIPNGHLIEDELYRFFIDIPGQHSAGFSTQIRPILKETK